MLIMNVFSDLCEEKYIIHHCARWRCEAKGDGTASALYDFLFSQHFRILIWRLSDTPACFSFLNFHGFSGNCAALKHITVATSGENLSPQMQLTSWSIFWTVPLQLTSKTVANVCVRCSSDARREAGGAWAVEMGPVLHDNWINGELS